MNDDMYAKLLADVRVLRSFPWPRLTHPELGMAWIAEPVVFEHLDAILEEHANVDSDTPTPLAEPPVQPEHGPEHNPGYDAIDW